MKRLCICLLGIVLMVSMFTGCGKEKPAPISEGGADGIEGFLTGSSKEEYMLEEDAELDLTGVTIACDRTILLQNGVTLTLTGTLVPGEGSITVRAGYENDSDNIPALDLSRLILEPNALQDVTFLEIRSDVKLTVPQAQERVLVDASSDEWTSIKSMPPKEDEPEENDPEDKGPEDDESQGIYKVSTKEEFLQAFADSEVEQFELDQDIAVDFEACSLTHNLAITCSGHVLTISGELAMQGGVLNIGEKPGITSGIVDISGLTVTCDRNAYASDTSDILFIGLDFKHINGEPKLGEDILYEIPDSGEHASVKLREVITPEQHEAKLKEEMTQYLSGVEFSGGVGISEEFLADGVLEIHLDNPVIDHEIGVSIDGGMKLILTGSVTFDGGLYGFELDWESTGMATVDISGLEIHGTKELGDTKSPDIFKITGKNVDLIYNENDPHIEVINNEAFWLRYVQ